jgi:hypothetical protein
MRRLICVLLAGLFVSGAAVGLAEAGDRRDSRHGRGRYERYDDRHHKGRGRYFSDREIRVVRDYYRPYYRYDRRGPKYRYYRSGYLPYGWHRRVRPYPVYVEREVIVLPHGYHRGIIDGHAVVYNSRGLIIDVAVLF